MRAVIQRADSASVSVGGELIASIGTGILLLVGFGKDDSYSDIEYIAEKCINLRIFNDAKGKMNLSVKDVDGEILSVSQFTLYGDANKGRRPSYFNAASPEEAKDLYNVFNNILRQKYKKIKTGIFQADMKIESVNNGPVTIIIDSKKTF